VTAVAARNATKSEPPSTLTLKQLAAQLADEHALSKSKSEALLGDLVTLVTSHLKQGTRLRLTGLGTLQVRQIAPRTGRNPATGETILIEARKRVTFRSAKELMDAIGGGSRDWP
jgi:DNA-binding protein HU-beta